MRSNLVTTLLALVIVGVVAVAIAALSVAFVPTCEPGHVAVRSPGGYACVVGYEP